VVDVPDDARAYAADASVVDVPDDARAYAADASRDDGRD